MAEPLAAMRAAARSRFGTAGGLEQPSLRGGIGPTGFSMSRLVRLALNPYRLSGLNGFKSQVSRVILNFF
jgi:hypothetical protein